MTKWSAAFVGFILAVIVETFFARYEFIGLLIVGFITGYIAHEGALGGLWNAAAAGAFGTIVCAIIFIIRNIRRTNRIYSFRNRESLCNYRRIDLLCYCDGNQRCIWRNVKLQKTGQEIKYEI